MENKQQLQLNNETLASILSNVLGLPSQESLKQGAYVWKKYDKDPAPHPITASMSSTDSQLFITFIAEGASSLEAIITKENLYSKGVTLSGENGPNISFPSTTAFSINGKKRGYTISYGSNSERAYATLTASDTSFLPSKTLNVIGLEVPSNAQFINFTVSDSPTAYPNGGEQGGYWYEKVNGFEALLDISEYTKISIDKFTLSTSSYNTDISHSLGEIPKLAMIFTDSRNNVTENSSILSAMAIYPIDEYGRISGSYNGIYSNINSNAPNYHYSSSFSVSSSSKYPSDTIIKWYTGSSSTLLQSGVEYTLITMA